MDFKLESQIVGVPDPAPVVVPEFKYLEVEVTRTEGSTLYLKVPGNFDHTKLRRDRDKILVKACKETLDDYDWDNNGWELDLEVQSVKEVTEKIAGQYCMYEVK
jgi:hypothetical protein